MGEEFKASRALAEAVAAIPFPVALDDRLQDLMDRNNDGRLSLDERKELESLAGISEIISLQRAKAVRNNSVNISLYS